MSLQRTTLLAITMALGAQLLPASAFADTAERITAAAAAVDELASTPDKSIPADLLKKAECIIVVPSMKSGALVVGGKYGRGFASCRAAGGWSAPAGMRVEGGSVGLQIGGTETELVMLVMNKAGVNRLLSTKFTLGGEAKVAAGPVGRSTTAQTDAAMTAEILSWSKAKGVFAGVALDGATLRQDDDANKDLYGKEMANKEILSGTVKAPAMAKPFLTSIAKF